MATTRLNPQGLSRREPLLMNCIIPDPGYVVVSVDLSAGEPTVVSHYSGDRLYTAANFGLVGKKPYWENGILMISDQYFMTASASTLGVETIKRMWDAGLEERWVMDDEGVKKEHKKTRDFFKVKSLAMLYEMGPDELVMHAARNRFEMSKQDAKAFKRLFWYELFPDVKKTRDYFIGKYKRDGQLVNDFGYRLLPDADYKAFNAWIQSTVSGLVKGLTLKFFHLAPYARYNCVLHDELLFQVPVDRVEDAKKAMDAAVESLNDDLGWRVKIRTGWVTGNTYFEAK